MAEHHLVVGPNKDEDNREFGELLEKLRIRANLSRADAAEGLGLSSEYIRLIERGGRTPAFQQARFMLELYGLPEPLMIAPGKLSVNDRIVEFSSRIQEARRKDTSELEPNRSERIGEIVRQIVTADDITLTKIQDLLH